MSLYRGVRAKKVKVYVAPLNVATTLNVAIAQTQNVATLTINVAQKTTDA